MPNTVPAAGEEGTNGCRHGFALWKEQNDFATDMALSDEEAEIHSSQATKLERLIVTIAPVTAQDFAMKLLATTYFGTFEPDETLVAEAIALAVETKENADV